MRLVATGCLLEREHRRFRLTPPSARLAFSLWRGSRASGPHARSEPLRLALQPLDPLLCTHSLDFESVPLLEQLLAHFLAEILLVALLIDLTDLRLHTRQPRARVVQRFAFVESFEESLLVQRRANAFIRPVRAAHLEPVVPRAVLHQPLVPPVQIVVPVGLDSVLLAR